MDDRQAGRATLPLGDADVCEVELEADGVTFQLQRGDDGERARGGKGHEAVCMPSALVGLVISHTCCPRAHHFALLRGLSHARAVFLAPKLNNVY